MKVLEAVPVILLLKKTIPLTTSLVIIKGRNGGVRGKRRVVRLCMSVCVHARESAGCSELGNALSNQVVRVHHLI